VSGWWLGGTWSEGFGGYDVHVVRMRSSGYLQYGRNTSQWIHRVHVVRRETVRPSIRLCLRCICAEAARHPDPFSTERTRHRGVETHRRILHLACIFFMRSPISLIAAGPALDNEIAAATAPQATGIKWPVLQPCR
jgi:hypothetical protein